MTNPLAAAALDLAVQPPLVAGTGAAAPANLREVVDAAPLGALQWAVAAMLTCVMILDGLDLQLAGFTAPVLMKQWQLTKPEFAPLLAAAMIGMAVGTMVGSWTGDRFGRRPTIVASVAFFGLMTAACAAASGPLAFGALRFMSGLGFGAAFPVATAMMSEWMPRRAASKAISIMTIGIPVGGMIGALATAQMLPTLGWRWCFAAAGLICVGFATVLLWRLPESPSFLALKARHGDVNALLARAWRRPDHHAGATWRVEPRPDRGEGLLRAENRRLNTGLWLAVAVNSFATYAVGFWVTVILTGLDLPLVTALRGPLTVSMSAIAGTVVVGWLITRLGSRTVMVGLTTLAFASAAMMSLAAFTLLPGQQLYALIFVGLALGGFCSGGLQPAYYVLAASAYETPIRSRGIGVAAVLGRFGAILSSFAGGAVLAFAAAGGFFAMVAGLALLALVGTLIINRHVPSGATRAA